MPFQPLDPLLHAELRLAIMSLLIGADEAEFPYIKEQTGATAGNLSVQIELSRQIICTESGANVKLEKTVSVEKRPFFLELS